MRDICVMYYMHDLNCILNSPIKISSVQEIQGWLRRKGGGGEGGQILYNNKWPTQFFLSH